MSKQIKTALLMLDPTNDNHWTSDGLPRIESVKILASNQTLSRDDINKAAPGFSRTNLAPASDATPAQAAQQPSGDAGTAQPPIEAPAGAVLPASALALQLGKGDGQVHTEDEEASGRFGNENSDLATELAFAQERLAQIEQYRVQILLEHAKATAEVDRLIVASEKAGEVETTGDAIRKYLASQNKVLEQRAAHNKKLQEANIDLKQLMPAIAPLDASLRNRKREQYRN